MYCTKCGRKLEDGEVCTCTQKTQVPHMQADPAQVKTPQMEQRQASGEQEQQEKNVFKNVHLNEKDTEWAREKGIQAAGAAKEICQKMLRTLKKPVSHAAEMAENADGND